MNVLEELCRLDYPARRLTTNPVKEKLRSLCLMNDDRMLTMLTEEQKIQFEKCQNVDDKLSKLMEQEAYSRGFSLAVQIMAAVMSTMDIPSIDELENK